MSKKIKLSDLVGKSSVRELVAAKLGCDVDKVPESEAASMAKSLKISVPAQLVTHTPKNSRKEFVYLVAGAVPGGRGMFDRIGASDDEVTEEVVEKLRAAADNLYDASESINELCGTLVAESE